MIVENYIFWSEIRSGFREPGGHTLTKDSKEYPQREYRRCRCPFEITKLLIEHMGRGTLDLNSQTSTVLSLPPSHKQVSAY